MNQSKTPFWTALTAYYERQVIPFHTPGHKLTPGPFANLEKVLGPGFFGLDPSDEIENLEINHDFELALQQAQELAAELFGAQDSLFLVNGTTGGLHYLLMPTEGPVLIPRFSHQAVYSGVALGEGHAVYLPTTYDQDWNIPLPPKVEEVKQALTNVQAQAIVLTHPTYYGTVSELEQITQLAQAHNVLVFVDEAHGGHFLFSDALPSTALECGADAVVQSTHKTLGSFTQTSMLHSQNSAWFSRVVQAQGVLQTTSPSLVFLGALDEVRRVLAEQGRYLVEKSITLANRCAKQLAEIPHIELLPNELQSDRTKLVFSLRKLGISGTELEHILRVDYNIQVELSDYYSVLALISLGDTEETVDKLVWAMNDLVKRKAHLSKKALPRYQVNMPSLPPVGCSLRQGFFAEKQLVPLKEATGRLSGGFLTPYPPGVPVIAPGEQFTQEIIEYLLWCTSINWAVRGLMEEQKVVVLKDNNGFCRKLR